MILESGKELKGPKVVRIIRKLPLLLESGKELKDPQPTLTDMRPAIFLESGKELKVHTQHISRATHNTTTGIRKGIERREIPGLLWGSPYILWNPERN